MDDALKTLLDGLYADGEAHDAAEPDRLRRWRNLEPDAAALLTQVVRIAAARLVVEIGTSNGYSTIWLADAVRDTGGTVVSVDVEAWPDTAGNLDRAGVASTVELRVQDGGAYLAGLPDGSVDLPSSTPSGSSTPPGGRIRCGCCGPVACSPSTTSSRTRTRSRRSSPSSPPTRGSPPPPSPSEKGCTSPGSGPSARGPWP